LVQAEQLRADSRFRTGRAPYAFEIARTAL
jgi:hypothetical protein